MLLLGPGSGGNSQLENIQCDLRNSALNCWLEYDNLALLDLILRLLQLKFVTRKQNL